MPEHVAPHVDFVTPTIHFDAKMRKRDQNTRIPISQAMKSGPKAGGSVEDVADQLEDCDKQITPVCLQALYGLSYDPVATDKNSYGIGVCASVTQSM